MTFQDAESESWFCPCAAGTLRADRAPRMALVLLNSDVRDLVRPHQTTLDTQLRSLLQWAAASMADVPHIQLSPDRDLQQVIFLHPPPGFPVSSRRGVFLTWRPMTCLDRDDAPLKETILLWLLMMVWRD